MTLSSAPTFTRESHFGTKVPKSLVAFAWLKETTRTIRAKQRICQT